MPFITDEAMAATAAELDYLEWLAEREAEHMAECRDPWCSCHDDPNAPDVPYL